jgi:hypothetical protein
LGEGLRFLKRREDETIIEEKCLPKGWVRGAGSNELRDVTESSAVQRCDVSGNFLGSDAEARGKERFRVRRQGLVEAFDGITEVLVVEGNIGKDREVGWGNKGLVGAIASAFTGPLLNVIGVGGVGKHLGVSDDDGKGLVVMESAPKLRWGSW